MFELAEQLINITIIVYKTKFCVRPKNFKKIKCCRRQIGIYRCNLLFRSIGGEVIKLMKIDMSVLSSD